jgi:RNA polymerase sigma-70 factor (ECF subfamily)
LDKQSADDSIRVALQRDDPAACELLWDCYAGDLLAFLQAVLCSKHDAEDVLQTVFVRIVRKRRHLAKAHCLDAYVHQMARNEAVSFLRRRRKRPLEWDPTRNASRVGTQSDAQPWLIAAEPADGSHEMTEALQAALTRLPPAQREIVVLKTYRDKTFREIAEMLELSLNTVASRYRYGLERLRALLKDPES